MLRRFVTVEVPACSMGIRALHDKASVPRVIPDYHKKRHKISNYGYNFNYYRVGNPLPRRAGDMQRITHPIKSDRQQWSPENGLIGRNDYIDLLGDGSLHPAQLLYHVPGWLRGFPGQHKANELVKLIHYRNLYKEKLKRDWPRRWHELCKHINWLMKYHNYRKQDEISNEREMGLWEEKPDYHFKDKKLRSFQEVP